MNQLKEIAEFLLENDDFTVVGHAMPDGDCVGSVLGLYHALKQLGKKVQVVLQDAVPPIYLYLAGADIIKTPQLMENHTENLVFLDCGDEERVGDDLLLRLAQRKLAVNIDHHQANSLFADYNYVETNAAATAEIIYNLIQTMQVELTPEISASLLAGIIMDTGSFMNSN
ncbi:DHH family phosphoesterase, partial [Syntrophomonas palmitatica]|uniref:DHH family phosphoesterase n=1 Tax=Syntrophomonas palmitatica TaxID=402877 RepID=UPI000B21DC8E